MEIQFFNSIFFWKKYFKDLLKIFVIELKEKFHYYYLKVIMFYPGVLIVMCIIGVNVVDAVTMMYGEIIANNEFTIYSNYISQLQKHLNTGMLDLDAALSIASFEPNPEYLYLYRLERKIELINLLLQKIKVKNTTHLNLNWTKTLNEVSEDYVTKCFVGKMLLYAKLYEPNLYNWEFKTKTESEDLNKILRIMVGEDSVLSKFDQALQMITFADSEILCKSTLPIYDCRLLFGEKQGLINFSNRYQNFTYMDLCTLECFVGQIVHLLISHYWILSENIDLEGECYLQFCWPRRYFISINGDEISTHWYLWERSDTQEGLVKSMFDILVEIMDKDDSYSKLMLGIDYNYIEPFVEAKRNGQEIAHIPTFRTDLFDITLEENLRTWNLTIKIFLGWWLYYGKS
jgi:hypothetical protein